MKRILLAGILSLAPGLAAVAAEPRTLTIDLTAPAKPISPDLSGTFFEALNYAAPAHSLMILRLTVR